MPAVKLEQILTNKTNIEALQALSGESLYLGTPGDVTPVTPSNADQLGGQYPLYYAKQADMDTVNTSLNGGGSSFEPNTAGGFSLDATFPNDARYNSARKLIKLFAKRNIVFGTGAYTQVGTLTDENMVPTKDQYSPVFSMSNGVQVGMAKYLISGVLQVFLFTELPANTIFYTQFDY